MLCCLLDVDVGELCRFLWGCWTVLEGSSDWLVGVARGALSIRVDVIGGEGALRLVGGLLGSIYLCFFEVLGYVFGILLSLFPCFVVCSSAWLVLHSSLTSPEERFFAEETFLPLELHLFEFFYSPGVYAYFEVHLPRCNNFGIGNFPRLICFSGCQCVIARRESAAHLGPERAG